MSLADIRAGLREVERRSRAGAARGLEGGADLILETSNGDVPLGGGKLLRSGKTSTDAAQLRAAVSYDTPYAIDAHEDLDLEHDSGRTPKFLENAMNTQGQRAGEHIADEIRAEWQR